jgi:hypothetical protein
MYRDSVRTAQKTLRLDCIKYLLLQYVEVILALERIGNASKNPKYTSKYCGNVLPAVGSTGLISVRYQLSRCLVFVFKGRSFVFFSGNETLFYGFVRGKMFGKL